jgi:hypothetical protein
VASVERARWAVGLGMPRDGYVVRYVVRQKGGLRGEGCPWDEETCDAAVPRLEGGTWRF